MSEDAVHRIQRAKRSAKEHEVALWETQAADDRGDIVKHSAQGWLAGRHAVAAVFEGGLGTGLHGGLLALGHLGHKVN